MPFTYTSVPTKIEDIIDPEVLADQVGAKFPEYLVLGNSPAVVIDREVPVGSPGTEFKIPFWKRIGQFAAMVEGDALVPGKMGTGAEYATVQRAGVAIENLDTAELVSRADPTGELAVQIARRAAEYVDERLVLRANTTPNSLDITGETTKTVTSAAIVDALIGTLGDQYAKMISGGMLIMHSKVMGDLMKLDELVNQYVSGFDILGSGLIPTLLGMPIWVSDRVTTTTVSAVTDYTTYIVAPESLALFFQRHVMIEFDRDILMQSNLVASTVHFAPHLYGYDQKTAAVVAEDNKQIRVVKLISR